MFYVVITQGACFLLVSIYHALGKNNYPAAIWWTLWAYLLFFHAYFVIGRLA